MDIQSVIALILSTDIQFVLALVPNSELYEPNELYAAALLADEEAAQQFLFSL